MSGTPSPPLRLGRLRMDLAIRGCECFQTKSPSALTTDCKKDEETGVGSVKNKYKNLGRIVIFTILHRPNHEKYLVFHVSRDLQECKSRGEV